MKIVINAVSARMGGAVSYITSLLPQLGAVEGDFEFIIFLPPETAAHLQGTGRNVSVLTTSIGHAGPLKRMWWEQVTLRRFLRKHKADVLFSTANFGMLRCPARQILLVRNSLYFSNIYCSTLLPKHSFCFRLAFKLRRWLICQSAKWADLVMTPTETMLAELRRFVEVKNAAVNPYGVTLPATLGPAKRNSAQRMNGKRGRTVRLLYVSLYGEHKNLGTLLKALPRLNRSGHATFTLETTADPSWAGAAWTVTHGEDLRLARQPGIAEHVRLRGPLSREAMGALYRACDIFIFPSLTESFGFPMAEAMLRGLPIVAADTPVNREICGDCAIYFNPFSPQELAERVLHLAADAFLCARLSAKSRQQAASRFSWRAHAERIIKAACCGKLESVHAYRVPTFTQPADEYESANRAGQRCRADAQ